MFLNEFCHYIALGLQRFNLAVHRIILMPHSPPIVNPTIAVTRIMSNSFENGVSG